MLRFIFVACFLITSAVMTADQHPNIVFILADDPGYGDVQCFNPQRCTIHPTASATHVRPRLRFHLQC